MHIADSSLQRGLGNTRHKGWSFRQMDSDLFKEIMRWYGVVGPTEEDLASAASLADWLTRCVCEACDVSTFRLNSPRDRPGVYWWNDAIAECRRVSIAARRKLTRRRRRGTDEEIADCRRAYKDAKKSLKCEIKKAKNNAWNELISTINDDP